MVDDTPTVSFSSSASAQPLVPSSDWRVDVLAQAERLEAQLARAREDAPLEAVGNAQSLIARAKQIASGNESVNWLRDLWSGLSVESAWRWLQQAQEELLLVRPEEELRGEIPYWLKLAGQNGEPATVKALSDWQTNDVPIDPHFVRPILAASHLATNQAHMALRRLRNRVLVWAMLLGALVFAVWSVGEVTSGDIAGIGALGGLLSVVFAVKNADLAAPYNVQFAQGMLKVASGAATAILAVLILKGGGTSTETTHIYEYAAIFGFSQQAFTRLIDEKAQTLTAKAPPRGDSTTSASPAAQPASTDS
jgi:hypothetical protein